MTKISWFFIVVLSLCMVQCWAQQADSLTADSAKADSLKKRSPIKLNTVTIRGQKPVIERRIDGIVFNVESLPAIAGSDALDVLRKVPMISVDGNGGLAVRGSANVKVLIDGKPSEIYASSVADALRTIRGEHIVKVEVITNPSSRYDAEGTDAVVNIITRKIRNDSTNGNISGVAGNRSESIMGDVHRKQGAILVNADAYYQKYWNRNGYVLQRNADYLAFLQQNETKQLGDYFFGGASVLYSLDSLNTFNIGYRIRRTSNTTTGITDNYEGSDPAFLFRRNTETPNQSDGDTYNVGFTGSSKNKKITYAILAMYAVARGANSYVLQQNDALSQYQERFFGTNHNDDFIVQADYSQSFGSNWKWEAGGKASLRNIENTSNFEVYDFAVGSYNEDTSRSSTFGYKNNIYAAYTNANVKLGNWGFTSGLRYEKTTFDAVFRNQGVPIPSFDNWVPQVLLNLDLGNKTAIKLSYAMKLVRPFISQLDPTVNTRDSLTLQYGNPKLAPEITNRYQFSYSVNDAKLFRDFMLFFNDNRNTIENIRLPIGNGRFESTWNNVGKNQQLGLAINLNWKPTAVLSIGTGLTTKYIWLASKALGISNRGLMQQVTLNGNYKLPNGYSIDLYGYFDSNNLRLQGYRSGWRYYSITVNKKFKNERLNLSLRADTFLTPHSYIDEVVTSTTYDQRQSYRYQNQNIRLTFSYNIGKKEIKSPEIRNIEQ